MVLLLLFSGSVIYEHGFQGRFPDRALKLTASLALPGASSLGVLGDCLITDGNQTKVFDDDSCIKTPDGKETYLVLGDSHAGSLWNGLRASLPDTNFVLAAVWGCRPSLHPEGSALCKQMMDYLSEKYLLSHSVQGLLLEARWYPKSMDGVGEIVAWAKAHGLRTVVFGPVAEYDAPLPRLLAYSIAWNMPQLAQEHLLSYSPVMDAEMRNMAEKTWHVSYVSLYRAICENDRCIEYADPKKEIPVLSDADHLSAGGSRLLVCRLVRRGELDWLR